MTIKLHALASAVALGSVLTLGAAQAADQKKAEDAPALDRYTRTGQYETCLTNHKISSTRILNDHQILFEMLGSDAYLAEPKTGCNGLRPNLALLYDATIDRLCNTTIVRLVDPSSPVPQMGTCNIERFEKLTKKVSQ